VSDVSPTRPESWGKELLKYSDSLTDFWHNEKPTAFSIETTLHEYRNPGANEPQSIVAGIVLALALHKAEGTDRLDLRMYFNNKEVKPRSRGLAFWRPAPGPDIVESPVTLSTPCALGECLAVLFQNPNPKLATLLVLNIQQAPPAALDPPRYVPVS
jgi:hypothetical protein